MRPNARAAGSLRILYHISDSLGILVKEMTFLKFFHKKSDPPAYRRIHLMDELRGFAVFCMVFYHAFYTLSFLLNWQWCKDLLNFFRPAEPWFAGLFIFISGIASNLSRSNLKRGVRLLAVALVVSAVTILVVPSEPIYFGILHLLSVAMILVGLTKKWLDKVPAWIGLTVCAAGFLFTMYIYRGFLGVASIPLIPLPRSWYTTDWLMPLGIYSPSFFSSDYFPIFPWLFVFLGGTILGRFASQGKFPAFTYRSRIPPLAFLGRHALVVYVLHQPIIYGIGMLIQFFMR
jgi:uncharacterized membrane protein